MIYTGYFAKTKTYEEANLKPVSVAGKTPDFFKHPKWMIFAPRKDMFYRWKSELPFPLGKGFKRSLQ